MTTPKAEIEALAEKHVDWLIKNIRPLLISEFVHGFEHGEKSIK